MVGDVCRIASMFHEHQDNLQEFLTKIRRASRFPRILGMVAESLSGSHQTIQSEIDSLVKKVDHIKQVIMSQQDIAHAGNIREAASAEDLMEQALMMGMPEPEKYGIRVVREYAHVPTIMTDRHHVLQILVNVITNAKNAMVEYPGNSHCLTVRIGLPSDRRGSVRFEVTDTGGASKLKISRACLPKALRRERPDMALVFTVPPSPPRILAEPCKRRVREKGVAPHSCSISH